MKTRWIHLITGFTMFVLCSSICITTSNAAVVWQDDFSDPNLPGWTIFGYMYNIDQYPVPREGNFSAADGTLKALDDYVNIARHDSSVSVGTWSFDMYVPDDDHGYIYVQVLSNGSTFMAHGNASHISVGAFLDEGKFIVWSIVGSTWTIHKNIIVDPLYGWHHIEVSRTDESRICVWFNEILEANFTTDRVTSTNYLQFYCDNATGAAIDNLVVTDGIPDNGITPPPPPDWFWIVIVGSVTAFVIVVAVVYLRRR